MTFLVLGLSHRTAPIDLLEQVAVPADLMGKALASVIQREHVEEAVVLSTCNRVEVYANVTRYHGGMADLREHFAEWAGLDPSTFSHLTYDHFDGHAVAHLFRVASGLESMVVGERQIHAQIRGAYATAIDEGTVSSVLNRVFRQAVRVGRRTRAETPISEGASSIVDLALMTAQQEMSSPNPRVLVIGAGKMGGMASHRIVDSASHVAVANRTPEKAADLVSRLGTGSAHSLDELTPLMEQSDLVITSTDATAPLISVDAVREVMASRSDRGLVLIDLAVPRDVESGVHEIPGVSVVDIEALRRVVTQGPTGDAVRQAEAIITEEVANFDRWTRGVQAGPTISALRERAEEVRQVEIARLRGRLSTLDEGQRDAVEVLTRRILNTLLHEPTVRLKDIDDTPDGARYVRALSHLFALGDPTRSDQPAGDLLAGGRAGDDADGALQPGEG